MTTIKDDLDAMRVIAEALENFNLEEQSRILRWVLEKKGLTALIAGQPTVQSQQVASISKVGESYSDIKSFVQEKNPQNDIHFAVAVAYFYRFQAGQSERKEDIGSDDLQEACRLSQRDRLVNPNKTLNNALRAGFLNKGSTKGFFNINTVGENLVAMSLPLSSSSGRTRTKKSAKNRKKSKK